MLQNYDSLQSYLESYYYKTQVKFSVKTLRNLHVRDLQLLLLCLTEFGDFEAIIFCNPIQKRCATPLEGIISLEKNQSDQLIKMPEPSYSNRKIKFKQRRQL